MGPEGNAEGRRPLKQDESVTMLRHNKMLRRLREMNDIEAAKKNDANTDVTLRSILQDVTAVKKQRRDFLRQVKRARAVEIKDIARQAWILDRKPYPHPRPWKYTSMSDSERESLTPEALASDPILEFEEIKRVRKEEATKHLTWKYTNANRAFEEPPLYSCTDSFKKILGMHLKQAVKKISRYYELLGDKAMDEGTVRLSEEKANVGADLWLMKSSLDEVYRGLRKAREIERLKLLKRGKDGMKVAPERFAALGDNIVEKQTIQTEDGSDSLG